MRAFFGLTFVAAGLLFVAPSYAQTNTGRWSLSLDGGVALPQNVNIKGGDTIDFDGGFRIDAGVGYKICPPLTAEVEAGLIDNSVNKIGGVAVGSYGGTATLYQVPLVAQIIWAPCLKGVVKPYLGVGIGGVATVANLDTPLGNVNDTDVVFCYQAEAGVKFLAGEHLELGVVYKFLGTLDHSWSENGVTLNTDGIFTHSIMAVLTWKF